MIFKKRAIEIYGFLLIFVYIKTYIMLTTFIILLILCTIWLSYEVWAAPTYDDNMNLIQPEKKFKDLFKKKL